MGKKKKKGGGGGKGRRDPTKGGLLVGGRLVESDLASDVPMPQCACTANLRKAAYRPHLCPIERHAQYNVFEQLYSVPLPRGAGAGAGPGRAQVPVPTTSMPVSQARAMLDKYLSLRLRFADPLDVKLAPVYARCAALHMVLGEVEAALACAQRAAELDPLHAASWYLLSWARAELGDLQGASSALLDGLDVHPGNVRLESALAHVQALQKAPRDR
jgi:tetratricopeptide (TPR) repeat protein